MWKLSKWKLSKYLKGKIFLTSTLYNEVDDLRKFVLCITAGRVSIKYKARKILAVESKPYKNKLKFSQNEESEVYVDMQNNEKTKMVYKRKHE